MGLFRGKTILLGVLVLSISVFYLGVVLALAPHSGFCVGDAGVKLWQIKTWIANGWRTPWARYPDANASLDPHHRLAPLEPPFAMWEGDRVLTVYTSPYVFASSLLLAKWGRLALYAPPLIAGMIGLVLQAWMGRRLSERIAWVAVVALGLATPWMFYSVVFWEHTFACVLIWPALALFFFHPGTPSPLACMAVGLGLGTAVMIRPEAFVCILALVAVLALDRSVWPSLGYLAVGLGGACVAAWVYHVSVVGQTAAGQVTANFAPTQFDLWSVERLFEASQMVVESRYLGVLYLLGAAAVIFGLGWGYRVLYAGRTIYFSRVIACGGLVLVAVGAGVLLFRGRIPGDLLTGVPVICLLALREDVRSEAVAPSRWRRLLTAWCVSVIGLSVVLAPNSGGPWGPRYLLPVVGPFVLLSVEAWERLRRSSGSRLGWVAVDVAFVALVLAGAMTQGAGLVKLRQVRAGNDALSKSVLRTPQAVVVTDIWFVPQIAPEAYGDVPFLLVRTGDEWRDLESRLVAQGVKRVRVVRLADWETALPMHVAINWRALSGTLVSVHSVPPLYVIDYVPE